MNQKDKQKQLLKLQQSLPPGLPEPPSWLVELARSVKKLEQVREMKNKRDVSGQKISMDSEKKYQGIVLDNYKNALMQVDKMHMKAVIQLKGIQNKTQRLEKYLAANQSSNK